jgi:hypothetical protein
VKQGGDEAALAVEHDDGLKYALVVVGVEQAQLLAAADRVERVRCRCDPLGNASERVSIKIDHRAVHSQQRANVRQVLQIARSSLRRRSAPACFAYWSHSRRIEIGMIASCTRRRIDPCEEIRRDFLRRNISICDRANDLGGRGCQKIHVAPRPRRAQTRNCVPPLVNIAE